MTAILAAAFLFNLGQGVLRPAMPLYLRTVFEAHYRMVTLIPVVFGAGRWLASLPAGVLQDRLGRRRLMAAGLVLIAASDVASALVSGYAVFLGLRALAGVGWAMFGTVATSVMVDVHASAARGRRASLLLMSETVGLLVGTAAGGWLYQAVGTGSPFFLEAACMTAGALVVARAAAPGAPAPGRPARAWRLMGDVLQARAVLRLGAASAALIAVQTGVMVFLFPLYLVDRLALAPATVGLLVSLGVLGRLLALWLGGAVATPHGRLRVLRAGLLAQGVLLAAVVVLDDSISLGVASLAIGAAAGLVAPLPVALIGDLVPGSQRGPAIGCLRSMTDAGQILGSLAMGTLADATGPRAPFVAAAVLLPLVAWSCRGLPDARGAVTVAGPAARG